MENIQVSFTDTSKECIQMMRKLAKEALKEGAKVVQPIIRESIPVKRGLLKKSIKSWAKIDYKTGQPYLDIGYLSRSQMKKKYGVKFFVNPAWLEFGVQPHSIITQQIKNGSKVTYKLHDDKNEYGYFVEHPGISSKNFLRNKVYENADKIDAAMQAKLKELENYVLSEGMTIDIGGDEEIE